VLRQVRELLEARFTESLRLAEIADAVGRHPVYLATSFRRAYGETIGDCVRRLRVERARRELEQSDAPIADVALTAGFANQSHLTRTFRKVTGMTPAAYRRLSGTAPHPALRATLSPQAGRGATSPPRGHFQPRVALLPACGEKVPEGRMRGGS
jgi:AraC-like DNA-binding protein